MNDFITIDFETGLFSPESAIAIGLVKFSDYQPVDSYYSLIRPPKLYIRPDFTVIHGLRVNDVKDAPDFKYIWENEIKEFIGTTILAAHNAQFDMTVLRAVLEWHGLSKPDLPYFCTCALSRRVWPKFKSHALTALAKKFDIVYNAHNALDDALTCGKLVQMSAEKFALKKNSSLEELFNAARIKIKSL